MLVTSIIEVHIFSPHTHTHTHIYIYIYIYIQHLERGFPNFSLLDRDQSIMQLVLGPYTIYISLLKGLLWHGNRSVSYRLNLTHSWSNSYIILTTDNLVAALHGPVVIHTQNVGLLKPQLTLKHDLIVCWCVCRMRIFRSEHGAYKVEKHTIAIVLR
jgi:hypothetical protein